MAVVTVCVPDHEIVRASVRLSPDMSPTEAAIAVVEDSRRTHVEWANYLARHPDDPAVGTLGAERWHRECIENYDLVLAVLRGQGDDRSV